jgi:hypothetical protein
MEAYSAQMLVAVQHEVQQASVRRLRELLEYFRQRQGPGLALVILEIRARMARRAHNYPPNQAAL